MEDDKTAGFNWRYLGWYAGLMAAALGVFLVIRTIGVRLVATAPDPLGSPRGNSSGLSNPLLHVLLALVVIILTSRLLGKLFARLRQPPVIGEMLAGLLLGASFLGKVAPPLYWALFPRGIGALIGIVAQVGVLLFMFMVGLELDLRVLRERSHAALAISHTSIVAPFLLGAALALWLYPHHATHSVAFTPFALFIGASMSITAFPVLARILTDRGLRRSKVGSLALTCAAVDDVTAWCLLAFVVGVVQVKVDGAAVSVLMTAVYAVVILVVVRPILGRFVASCEGKPVLDQETLVVVCVGLFSSSLATELIGIHSLFGAFLFGAIIPAHSRLARELTQRLHDFVVVAFLPAFFAFTGIRTELSLISGGLWITCGLIILVACLGKFGGSAIAARMMGMTWRESAGLGVLMNTRGLMELIALNIGLDLKVITPTLFAMMVVMAVTTTMMTTPVLDTLMPGSRHETESCQS